MFFIIVITFIAITFLLLIFHLFRKLCQDPVPPPPPTGARRAPCPPHPPEIPRAPCRPPLTLMPTLPSLPSGAIPVGLEPPPYSEVTAKPFLYPLPQGPCPECGHMPTAQPPLTTRT
ncbi:homeobox protein ESX1-like [Corvus kubaryi]|uniref:homeobox protein ESX1-like n=1 Tax=Corvus kubaryi TaxID=68294 RepID=UPI001C05ADA7|nr:homeobox protein ESX1-like [Corvus kubaryi]